ncbi:capsule biosynthesis GfcC family protein [Aliiglaciecola sp. NS0011-25]|uniref:capsule biosynthesis GfcC family protein n=1 Tax=Aliiglaciecola sp. NS0011-25 TaxID=3127654 RepID=UPI0031056186
MNRLKSLFTVILFSFCINNYANSQVEVTVNGNILNFAENPRLNQVLESIALEQNWYWRASQLFKLDSDIAEKSRQELVKQLSVKSKVADSATFNQLIKQIESWTLAQRIDIAIDYDLARFQLNHNPLFDDGKYRLTLSKRMTTLFIFGAVSQPSTIEYENNQCIENIVAQISKTESADANIVYAIQPDGVIRQLPVAYWNQKCHQVMPGTQLYIPLVESQWFADNSQLNQLIAELAVNRVVIE